MELPDTNLVVLAGRISADPLITELPSGSVVYSWSVNIAASDGPAISVPIVAFDPPAALRAKGAAAPVVVTGHVKRRFFRSRGATQSRTEVVVAKMVSATAPGRVASTLAAARKVLDRLD